MRLQEIFISGFNDLRIGPEPSGFRTTAKSLFTRPPREVKIAARPILHPLAVMRGSPDPATLPPLFIRLSAEPVRR
jgi:hypothetical protein